MADPREYPSHPICGVGAIVRKKNSVLLVRRGKAPRNGEWSIPGGAVELGESARQAAEREIREECAIGIAIFGIAEVVDIIERDADAKVRYHYMIVDFAAEYVSGDLLAQSDVSEARWVERGELDAYPMNPQTRAVIEKALA